jgi:hypothetical protein
MRNATQESKGSFPEVTCCDGRHNLSFSRRPPGVLALHNWDVGAAPHPLKGPFVRSSLNDIGAVP